MFIYYNRNLILIHYLLKQLRYFVSCKKDSWYITQVGIYVLVVSQNLSLRPCDRFVALSTALRRTKEWIHTQVLAKRFFLFIPPAKMAFTASQTHLVDECSSLKSPKAYNSKLIIGSLCETSIYNGKILTLVSNTKFPPVNLRTLQLSVHISSRGSSNDCFARKAS